MSEIKFITASKANTASATVDAVGEVNAAERALFLRIQEIGGLALAACS